MSNYEKQYAEQNENAIYEIADLLKGNIVNDKMCINKIKDIIKDKVEMIDNY